MIRIRFGEDLPDRTGKILLRCRITRLLSGAVIYDKGGNAQFVELARDGRALNEAADHPVSAAWNDHGKRMPFAVAEDKAFIQRIAIGCEEHIAQTLPGVQINRSICHSSTPYLTSRFAIR